MHSTKKNTIPDENDQSVICGWKDLAKTWEEFEQDFGIPLSKNQDQLIIRVQIYLILYYTRLVIHRKRLFQIRFLVIEL